MSVIEPIFRTTKSFLVVGQGLGISGLLPLVVDEKKGRLWEEFLKEAIDHLGRFGFLVIQVVDLSEGVHEDYIWMKGRTVAEEFHVLTLGIKEGEGEWRSVQEPDILRGSITPRAHFEALVETLKGSVKFYVEDVPLLNGETEEAFPRANGRSHLPGKGALSDGGVTPKEGDSTSYDVGID